jgi:hypothetical protein
LSGESVAIDQLVQFLASRGATPELLLSEVDQSFGQPLLVVATGSVVHGFGNERSDIDLSVVVDRDKLSQLPIVSFKHGILHDVAYFTASGVRSWAAGRRDQPWPPTGAMDREAWRRCLVELFHCIRFAYSVIISAREGWDDWLFDLRAPWLIERVIQWWRIEAERRRVAGRWLMSAKPLLAAQQYCEAVLAALESRAAAAGQVYLKPKWLPEKLRVLEDEAALEKLHTALRIPTTSQDVTRYTASCEALLEELLVGGDDRDLVAQLWYAPGVRTRNLGKVTLVTRWDLRGVELSDAALPNADGPQVPVWQGQLDTRPSPQLLTLFFDDMMWLSVSVSSI